MIDTRFAIDELIAFIKDQIEENRDVQGEHQERLAAAKGHIAQQFESTFIDARERLILAYSDVLAVLESVQTHEDEKS